MKKTDNEIMGGHITAEQVEEMNRIVDLLNKMTGPQQIHLARHLNEALVKAGNNFEQLWRGIPVLEQAIGEYCEEVAYLSKSMHNG